MPISIFSSLLVGGVLLSYVLSFKEYHKAVDKHSKLTELLYHPNAKVATGDQAKQILKAA
jgi:hypothetical protein